MKITSGFFAGLQFSGYEYLVRGRRLRPLEGAPASARILFNYFSTTLGRPEEWVDASGEEFEDCTRSEVFLALVQWLTKTRKPASKRRSLSVVYLSGHGVIDAGSFVLLSSDTRPEIAFETGVPIHAIYHLLKKEHAHQRYFVLILDACMEGYEGQLNERLPKNVCVIFSAGQRGYSAQHNNGTVFCGKFMEALNFISRDVSVSKGASDLINVVVSMKEFCNFDGFYFISNVFEAEVPISKRLAENMTSQHLIGDVFLNVFPTYRNKESLLRGRIFQFCEKFGIDHELVSVREIGGECQVCFSRRALTLHFVEFLHEFAIDPVCINAISQMSITGVSPKHCRTILSLAQRKLGFEERAFEEGVVVHESETVQSILSVKHGTVLLIAKSTMSVVVRHDPEEGTIEGKIQLPILKENQITERLFRHILNSS